MLNKNLIKGNFWYYLTIVPVVTIPHDQHVLKVNFKSVTEILTLTDLWSEQLWLECALL